jgi:hypothetical protein
MKFGPSSLLGVQHIRRVSTALPPPILVLRRGQPESEPSLLPHDSLNLGMGLLRTLWGRGIPRRLTSPGSGVPPIIGGNRVLEMLCDVGNSAKKIGKFSYVPSYWVGRTDDSIVVRCDPSQLCPNLLAGGVVTCCFRSAGQQGMNATYTFSYIGRSHAACCIQYSSCYNCLTMIQSIWTHLPILNS